MKAKRRGFLCVFYSSFQGYDVNVIGQRSLEEEKIFDARIRSDA